MTAAKGAVLGCDVAADWAPATGSLIAQAGVTRIFHTAAAAAAANQLLLRDFPAAAVVAAAAAAWVDAWRRLQQRGVLSSVAARKVLHMTTGPMFVACWPLFSHHPYSRVLASLVLVVQLVRLMQRGAQRGGETATNNHRSLAASIARNGSEQLRGPVTYVFVLFVITMLLWRNSVPALVAVGQLAGGDATAEIVGTRVPSVKWQWSRTHKSLAGSLGFVTGGFCMSLCLLLYFRRWRLIAIDIWYILPRLLLISVIAAGAELLPFGDDNLWVPLAAACATRLLVSVGSSPNRTPNFSHF